MSAEVRQFPAFDLERNWREFWRIFSIGIRAQWAGVPDLEDALVRAAPRVRHYWFALYEAMPAEHIRVHVNVSPDSEHYAALQAAAETSAARSWALIKRRIDGAAVAIALEALRAETGWHEAAPKLPL